MTSKRQEWRALEKYVNCGDTPEDFKAFRLHHSTFFPAGFYDISERLLFHGHDTPFHWYKRQLRSVWSGADLNGARFSALLGLISPGNIGLPGMGCEQEAKEYIAIEDKITRNKLSPVGGSIMAAIITPSWRTGEMNYMANSEFQVALRQLMAESWRAKICPIDAKFFVAEKPPNLYCSPDCTLESKRRRGLHWWRTEGSKQRRAAIRRGKR